MATNKIQEKIESVKSEDVKEAITATLQTFTKEQLVKSNKYVHRRDALNALLQDNKLYSFTEVEGILKQFEEGGKA
ncbi:hypothetical protein [Lysinibacillus sp. FSL P4-0201]|uniref:hypothetical protein n=1 Tax=Lysinibacillus sp. FSL P4-0201 TaxID=2921721 RepID=UPI00315A6290